MNRKFWETFAYSILIVQYFVLLFQVVPSLISSKDNFEVIFGIVFGMGLVIYTFLKGWEIGKSLYKKNIYNANGDNDE